MSDLLKITNLSVDYYRNRRVLHALDGVSLGVAANETISIVGESGCGKSTLAYSILRLISPAEGRITQGSILYRDADILGLRDKELRRIRGKEISMVFQDPFSSLNPVITVGEQIRETLIAHDAFTSPDVLREKTLSVIRQVKLPDPVRIYNAYPHQLSGGQRQRVSIAIALMTDPRILIADEPTTALDVTTADEILNLLWELQAKRAMSVLFITHNLHLAFRHSDRIIVMYAGEIIEEGKTSELLKDPRHPYTRKLLALLPSLDKKGKLLSGIPGQVPDMVTIPAGCRFMPRCDKASVNCGAARPSFTGITATHRVKCEEL